MAMTRLPKAPADIPGLVEALNAKVGSSELVSAVAAAVASDPTVQELTNRLVALLADTYDLDAMPSAYTGGSGYHEKLQWIMNRLTLTDAGAATERNVTVLVGQGVYDVSSAALQETGTLGTYGDGATRKGANCQLMFPATGPLATKKCLVFTFRAKQQSSFGYSVVNGDPTNVMPTNAVIRSTMSGMGSAAMIGVSRSLDGYAGLYLSNIIVRNEGVTFRVTAGLTAIDLSHAFSFQGPRWICDTGTASNALPDPRRKSDGTWFVEGVTPDGDECAFVDRQFGIKTPMLWNGGDLNVDSINCIGFRYGIDANEHLRINYLFADYCFAAVKARCMSHTAIIDTMKVQRCPIGVEGPELNDWFGRETNALLIVRHYGGESYHPGVFGNPPEDRWFNHRYRFTDPNNLWTGWVEYHASPGELPGSSVYATIPDGHGENLQIRMVTDPLDTTGSTPDFTPAVRTLTDGATITMVADALQREQRDQVTLGGSGRAVVLTGLADGMEGTFIVKQDATGGRTITSWTAESPSMDILWKDGTEPTLQTAANARDRIEYEVIGTEVYAEYIPHGTASGGGGAGGPDTALPTLEGGTAAYIIHYKVDAGLFDQISGGSAPADGGRVGRWQYTTGEGVAVTAHLTAAANDTTRPIYRVGTGAGGHDLVEFDQAAEQTLYVDPAGFGSYDEPYVWMIAGRFRNPLAGEAFAAVSGGGNYKAIGCSGSPLKFAAMSGYPAAADIVGPNADSDFHLFELHVDPDTGEDKLVIDGVEYTGNLTVTGTQTRFGGHRLGALDDGGLLRSNVDVQEEVMITNPAANDITNNRSRLRTKYGV